MAAPQASPSEPAHPFRRLAALYDVHGNVHALEAVLADVERADVDLVLFGGDVVAGPFPRETVELDDPVERLYRQRAGGEVAAEDDRLDAFPLELREDDFERRQIAVNVVERRDAARTADRRSWRRRPRRRFPATARAGAPGRA